MEKEIATVTYGRYCLCTTSTINILKQKASDPNETIYRSGHPWYVAKRIVESFQDDNLSVPLIFAAGEPLSLRFWATVSNIDILESAVGRWETHCAFGALKEVNPIWSSLDSIFIAPSNWQLERERTEQLSIRRQSLSSKDLYPYAICETPAFIK